MSQEKQTLPFFTRYLENQVPDMSAEELNEVSGGASSGDDIAYFKKDETDGGYPLGKYKSPFDISFPTFPNTFPFNKGYDDGFNGYAK